MKYWEIIADSLKKRGWSLGWVSAIVSEGRTVWIGACISQNSLIYDQLAFKRATDLFCVLKRHPFQDYESVSAASS
jgi:hypothetical protein